MAFKIKAGDTRPIYLATLKDNPGLPGEDLIDLTTADEVVFLMRHANAPEGSAPAVSGVCVIEDAVGGIVSYEWQPGDTEQGNGTYNIEFQITWTDGGIETIPNAPSPAHSDGYLKAEVFDDLGG